MELRNFEVNVDIQNTKKLAELLQKAADQLEQLEKTIDEISKILLEISINKKGDIDSIGIDGVINRFAEKAEKVVSTLQHSDTNGEKSRQSKNKQEIEKATLIYLGQLKDEIEKIENSDEINRNFTQLLELMNLSYVPVKHLVYRSFKLRNQSF